jgi:hypothetical protein
MRQGPHQGAQKSTTTGTAASDTSLSKTSAPCSSMGEEGCGRIAWHLPHRVVRSTAAYRSRFVAPHDGQGVKTPRSSSLRCDITAGSGNTGANLRFSVVSALNGGQTRKFRGRGKEVPTDPERPDVLVVSHPPSDDGGRTHPAVQV